MGIALEVLHAGQQQRRVRKSRRERGRNRQGASAARLHRRTAPGINAGTTKRFKGSPGNVDAVRPALAISLDGNLGAPWRTASQMLLYRVECNLRVIARRQANADPGCGYWRELLCRGCCWRCVNSQDRDGRTRPEPVGKRAFTEKLHARPQSGEPPQVGFAHVHVM